MVLSPELIQQLIINEEHTLRSQTYPRSIVGKVFRYGGHVGHVVEHFAKVPRCMEMIRRLIEQCETAGRSFSSGLVVSAGELTGGKGRFERQWHAPLGGVWMVVGLVNTLLSENKGLVSLAAGIACCETVRHYGVPAMIKWVNDVHVGGRKLAGILIETMQGPGSGEEYVLVGIGLNVNNREFPEYLSSAATSMSEILKADLDLDLVAARFISKMSWNIGLLHYIEDLVLKQEFAQNSLFNGCHPIIDRFRLLSDTIGREVLYGFNVVSMPQYRAKVLDIMESGALRLRLADGTKVNESGGEIVYI